MNPLFLHCSRCIQIPKSDGPQFFITSCGNVICQKCLTIRSNLCNKCGGNCLRKLISNRMSPDVAFVFMNPAAALKRLRHKIAFQTRRFDGYIKHLTGRVTSLENALRESKEKIHALELRKSALRKSIGKLKEHNSFLKEQQSESPVVHNKSTEFANAFLNAISQSKGNETNHDGFFPRDTLPFNSFDNRSIKSGSFTETPRPPRKVRFNDHVSFYYPSQQENFQSTPITGHKQIGLNNFGFTSSKPVSSIISNRYYR